MKLNLIAALIAFSTVNLAAETQYIVVDSLPARMESYKIIKKTNDQDIDMSIVNGEVKELKIDGKTIAPEDYVKYQSLIDSNKPQTSRSFGEGSFPGGQIFNFDLGDMEGGTLSIDDLMGKIDMDGMRMSLEDMQQGMFGTMNLDSLMKSLKMMDVPMFNQEIEVLPYGSNDMKNGDSLTDGNNFSEILGNVLNRDGFLIPDQDNKVELTGKYLKINGEKQPNNIYQKYKRIFEEQTGVAVDKKTNLQFSIKGKEPKRKYRTY